MIMHTLVRITRNEDGEPVDEPVWHYLDYVFGSDAALCSGEVIGAGEGTAEFELKTVKRGGITCSRCMNRIRDIKSIKL